MTFRFYRSILKKKYQQMEIKSYPDCTNNKDTIYINKNSDTGRNNATNNLLVLKYKTLKCTIYKIPSFIKNPEPCRKRCVSEYKSTNNTSFRKEIS